MKNAEDFKIIWKHFSKDSTLGVHLKAQEDFSLPYFLAGEEKKKFETQEAVTLTEFHLVKGLLVGYFDKPPNVDTTFAQSMAQQIITEQIPAFKARSLEQLIIDLSNFLRDSYGQLVSLQSLSTGAELLPESSVIRYDCCIDLINCIDDGMIEDRIAAVKKLKILLSEIRIDTIDPDLVRDYRQMLEIAKEFSGD